MADTPFIAKTDPFAISGTGKPLALVSVADNKSASVAEAHNDKGDTVAWHMYGVQYAPQYDYRVAGSGTLTIPKFGEPVNATMADGTAVKLFATGWTLNTGAGSEGCYLQTANYAGSCTLGRPTKDGDAIAAGVTDGRITAALTILQTGSAIPTLTVDADWDITAPLTCTNPDAEYPTWTVTLTQYLTAEDAS